MRVSVIGGGAVSEEHYDDAREVGRLLAERGHVVVCGGLTGVMTAVCRGANEAGGDTVGILPGEDPGAANPYVDIPIATGMGNLRNGLVALNGNGAIAIEGGTGTLSEIALALDRGVPVAGIDTHDVPGVEAVDLPREAVEHVEANA